RAPHRPATRARTSRSPKADPRQPVVAVAALELLPRHEGARVGDAVEEQHAVEMVHLVLERARAQSLEGLLALVPVAVEVAHADSREPVELAAQAGHREAPLD